MSQSRYAEYPDHPLARVPQEILDKARAAFQEALDNESAAIYIPEPNAWADSIVHSIVEYIKPEPTEVDEVTEYPLKRSEEIIGRIIDDLDLSTEDFDSTESRVDTRRAGFHIAQDLLTQLNRQGYDIVRIVRHRQ